MQPSVSVVIPVFNGENNIEIPIKSLQNQTYINFEVVIIDDGSTDQTSEKIECFSNKDSRIKYYYQKNNGVAAARNKGIEKSTGKYISFLDSDDFYEPDFLERMVYKISNEKLDYAYCGYNIVTPESKKKRNTKFHSSNLLLDYIKGNISIPTTGWIIRKQFIIDYQIHFPIGIAWGEDFEFFCEMLAYGGKYGPVKDYLVSYRVGFEENRLSSFSLRKLDEEFNTIMRLVSNDKINKNGKIQSALLDYRLPARLTYGLLEAVTSYKKSEIKNYFFRYEQYINRFSLNNGVRSFKLLIKRKKLKRYIKNV